MHTYTYIYIYIVIVLSKGEKTSTYLLTEEDPKQAASTNARTKSGHHERHERHHEDMSVTALSYHIIL